MDTSDEKIEFDEKGMCNHCKKYDAKIKNQVFDGKVGKEKLNAIIKSIKEKSQLVIEGKPPIQAVEVFTNQDGENIDLYVAFPRYQNNQPLISLEDKKVEVLIEFESGFRITRIEKEFKLKDMQYEGKLEI